MSADKQMKGYRVMKNNRKLKNKIFLILTDAVFVLTAGILAYVLTMKETGGFGWKPLSMWLVADLAAAVLLFMVFGMYDIVFSSVGIIDALKLCIPVLCLCALNAALALFTHGKYIRVDTAFLFSAFLFYFAGMVRFSKRILIVLRYFLSGGKNKKKRVMIVGGGSAGLVLIKEMLTSDKIAYKPVCIADDDPTKLGNYISGVKVAGSTYDVKQLAEKYRVEEIFVTMPAASKKKFKVP